MFSIVYECTQPWPDEGPMQIEVPPIAGEVCVSPVSARRRANSYLSLEVAMEFQPGEPVLVWKGRPVWRMPVNLHLPEIGELVTVGTLEVDGVTREVHPLTESQIHEMRARAHDLVTRLTPSAEPVI